MAELFASWTCFRCKIATFREMIACDHCDQWYHWCQWYHCVAWRQTSSKVIKESILLVTIYPWPQLFWIKKQCFALSLLEVFNVKVRGQSQHFSSPTTWENFFFRLAILQEIIRKVCEFSFEGVLPTYNVSDVVLSQQVVCWNHRGADILVLWELPNYQKNKNRVGVGFVW